VETLVDKRWNVHLGREMAVCLIVIPGGRVVVYLSPCVNPRERELAKKREPEHENIRMSGGRGGRNTMEREGRNSIWYMVSYHTVLVSYRTVYGIVPYGIGPQGGKSACVKRRLASFSGSRGGGLYCPESSEEH
jgi:hypothetical protein